MGAVWSRLIPGYREAAYYDDETPQIGIAVLSSFQGRGVGSRLMAHFLERARDQFPAVSLGVHPENQRAIKLYERFDFDRFGTGPGNYVHMLRVF
jgi:ribosomal protein S18 acetylase RimI-like enzyme